MPKENRGKKRSPEQEAQATRKKQEVRHNNVVKGRIDLHPPQPHPIAALEKKGSGNAGNLGGQARHAIQWSHSN
jgi:hypothetical protein